MTLCRKCGKEIPDGEELCESCKNNPTEIDESYLDELMKSMEQTQRNMGVELGKADTAEEIIPEELSFGNPVDIAEDSLTADPVALEDLPEPEAEAEAAESEEEPLPELVLEDLPEPEAESEEEPLPELVLEDLPEPEAEVEEPESEEEPLPELVPEDLPEPEAEAEAAESESEEEPLPELVLEDLPEPEAEAEAAEPESEEEPLSELVLEDLPEPEAEAEAAEPESEEEPLSEPALEDLPETEPEAEEPVSESAPDQEDDINKLLDMLSDDYVEEEDSASSEDSQDLSPEAELDEEPELPVFDGNDDGFFADSSEEEEDTAGPSLDDVFNEALSAVEYSENEEGQAGESADEPFALDDFGMEDDLPPEADNSSEADASEGVTVQPAKKPKLKKAKKPKKPKPEVGFWKRTFGNIVTPETAELEAKEREDEAASKEQKAKLKEEKKQKDAEEKALKAEQQKAEKEKKAAAKAEKVAAAKAKKEEKKRVRLEQEANEVVGKINPVGATIVMVFFGVICLVIVLGTQAFSYSRAVRSAQTEFDAGDYEDAYDSISGVDVSESSQEMAEKVRICMQLKKELNSYSNYYKMKMYLEAVDSLMKGIRSYDTNKDTAYSYNIMSQYDALKDKIVTTLDKEFGITEAQARAINNTESRVEYTEKLQEIVDQWKNKVKQDEK